MHVCGFMAYCSDRLSTLASRRDLEEKEEEEEAPRVRQTCVSGWLTMPITLAGLLLCKFNKPHSPWWTVTWELYYVVSMR
jgi:hypothetical protein